MSTVSIRDLSRNASAVIAEVSRTGTPALITKGGEFVAAVVALSPEEVEDYVLATSKEILDSLAEAEEDLTAGRTVSHEDVFAHLDE